MLINVPNISFTNLVSTFLSGNDGYYPTEPITGWQRYGHQGWTIDMDPCERLSIVAEILDDLREAGYHPTTEIGELTHHDGFKVILAGCPLSEMDESILEAEYISSWEINAANSLIANIQPGTNIKTIMAMVSLCIEAGWTVYMEGSVK